MKGLKLPGAPANRRGPVKPWTEPVMIPIYHPPAGKNPIFPAKPVYPGSSCCALRKPERPLLSRSFQMLHDVSHLPASVTARKQSTAGHLSKLANPNGAILATHDENVPGSYLIPK